jgi:hypothetical protein
MHPRGADTVAADAAVHKVAQIAYASFGDAFNEKRDDARKEYTAAMAGLTFNMDHDEDGELSEDEEIKEPSSFLRV